MQPPMKAYPQNAGVTAGQTLELCVQPGVARFKVAFLRQGANADYSLVPVNPLPPVQALRFVTRTADVFASAPVSSEAVADLDWQWPRIAFSVPASWVSGVYFAVPYEVDSAGQPIEALGTAIVNGQPVKPMPPQSDGMALFVVRPASPVAKIAYVLALSTYHAYNHTGGGCFYYPNEYYTVTLRRPGGGVASEDMWQEADPYDTTSRRNTYAHWDSKWTTWLAQQGTGKECDFYTSLDLSDGAFLMNGTAPAYKLLLVVGHDEYWDQPMRDALKRFRAAGGNVAIFSGNTCNRPVAYSGDSVNPVSESRLGGSWDALGGAAQNESELIGVSWAKGAATWNEAPANQPPNPPRTVWAVGYTVQSPGHWVFAGTSLNVNDTFGQGQDADTGAQGDHLVGYECDGVVEPCGNPGTTPCAFQRLGVGLTRNQPPTGNPLNWRVLNGSAVMGILEPTDGTGTLFNAATTDWARLLMTATVPVPDGVAKVRRITLNVIERLST